MSLRCSRLPVLVALTSALVAGTSYGEQERPPAADEVAGLVIELTNEFRVQQGRNQLAADARLTGAARYFARYMAKTDQFSHDADGTVPAARAQKFGYDYCIVSENLAYREVSGQTPARELARGLVEGWKKSPGHRQNMLESEVTDIGAAVAQGKKGAYYAVQTFGRPASRAIKFSIANQSNAAVRYQIGGKTFPLAPGQARTHTQCRPEELKFDWPGGQQDSTIKPKDGERLAVVRSDSGFSIRAE